MVPAPVSYGEKGVVIARHEQTKDGPEFFPETAVVVQPFDEGCCSRCRSFHLLCLGAIRPGCSPGLMVFVMPCQTRVRLPA